MSVLYLKHTTALGSRAPSAGQSTIRAHSSGLKYKNGTDVEKNLYVEDDAVDFESVAIGGATLESDYSFQLPNDATKKAKAYAFDEYSSKKWKTKLVKIKNPFQVINKFVPYFYRNKKGFGDNGKHLQVGLLSEDVKKVMPSLSTNGESVNYARITALLIADSKVKEKRIIALEKAVANLKKEIKKK